MEQESVLSTRVCFLCAHRSEQHYIARVFIFYGVFGVWLVIVICLFICIIFSVFFQYSPKNLIYVDHLYNFPEVLRAGIWPLTPTGEFVSANPRFGFCPVEPEGSII
jgi:hypothetical protein